jgi:hypothetical protein
MDIMSGMKLVSMYDHFGEFGLNKGDSRNLLRPLIPELNTRYDFQGVFVFWLDEKPFYMNSSMHVIDSIYKEISEIKLLFPSILESMLRLFSGELTIYPDRSKESEHKRLSPAFKKILREDCEVSFAPIENASDIKSQLEEITI